MNHKLDQLNKISRAVGGQVAYVQGGGGNTSLKTNDTVMFIKASGRFLADIDIETGFLPVDWRRLNDEIDLCETNVDYDQLLTECTLSNNVGIRPSIETGLIPMALLSGNLTLPSS